MDQEQGLQNEEQLSQLSVKELVEIILNQQKIITELQIKIEKLILSRDLDSKNSSKPPSSDLLKKPEKKPEGNPQEKPLKKKKPGGQLGHPGKTRKGFGRVDRYEQLKAEKCSSCGQLARSLAEGTSAGSLVNCSPRPRRS